MAFGVLPPSILLKPTLRAAFRPAFSSPAAVPLPRYNEFQVNPEISVDDLVSELRKLAPRGFRMFIGNFSGQVLYSLADYCEAADNRILQRRVVKELFF